MKFAAKQQINQGRFPRMRDLVFRQELVRFAFFENESAELSGRFVFHQAIQ